MGLENQNRGENLSRQQTSLHNASIAVSESVGKLSLVHTTLKQWVEANGQGIRCESIDQLADVVDQILHQNKEATGHIVRAKQLGDLLLVNQSNQESLHNAVKNVFENASVKPTDRVPTWWGGYLVPKTYGELVCYSKEEALQFNNIGIAKIQKMEEHLKEVGLQFRQD